MDNNRVLLSAFLRGEIDNSNFHHDDHVRIGFEILRHHTFGDAAAAVSRSLRSITARAGRPEAYHETITLAFLSLIAERLAAGNYLDFESFAGANADLLNKSALERWYTRDRLGSELARKTFVLPGAVQ